MDLLRACGVAAEAAGPRPAHREGGPHSEIDGCGRGARPEGWSHESSVRDADLWIDSHGLATVVSHNLETTGQRDLEP